MSDEPLHTRHLGAGMTRDCTDPWSYIEVTTEGDVRPCCARPPVGSLMRQTLVDILNGDAIRDLRWELLSGAPAAQCVRCRLRAPIKTEQFHKKIERLMEEIAIPADFDPDAYRAANPDVAEAKLDPIAHFEQRGRFEGRALRPVKNAQR